MEVIVELIPQNKTKKLKVKEKTKIVELLRKLKINQEIVVVFRGNIPLSTYEILNENDKLRIVRVVSGG